MPPDIKEKAFNREDGEALWQIMTPYGVSEYLIQVCGGLNKDCRNTV